MHHKSAQTNCQCVSSQFIASKTQERHSRENIGRRLQNFVNVEALIRSFVVSVERDILLTPFLLSQQKYVVDIHLIGIMQFQV